MKRPVSSALIAYLFATVTTPAIAQPFCEALLDEAQLEKKYKRLAPIHSSKDNGWIFTSDMMRETYAMKPEALALFQQIVAEFDTAGVPLAVMIAPPRPVVAGQDIVNETLGGIAQYDVAKAKASFEAVLSQIQTTGATTPDLLNVALTEDGYFFKRDTHWTNVGAAHSANALANSLSLTGFDFTALPVIEMGTEKGSLSNIVKATCGAPGAAEPTPIYDFSALRPMGGLLDDPSSDGRVALLGTSYSNRYKRDAYQAADAIATALETDVDNFSMSGGGLIGTLEAYVLSGALAAKTHEMVIWEFPYTQSLNSTSALRQLLGTLRSTRATESAAKSITLDKKGRAELKLTQANAPFDLLIIEGATDGIQQLMVDVMFDDKSKATIKLVRTSRVNYPAAAVWAADLSGLDTNAIGKIKLRANADAAGLDVTLRFAA